MKKDYFNSPEFKELQEKIRESEEKYKGEVNEFWNNLSYEDQLKAFYFVCSKIYEGDVVDQGSYRHCLYSIFSFDMDSYALGMECGYLDLHNLISDGIEYRKNKGENSDFTL